MNENDFISLTPTQLPGSTSVSHNTNPKEPSTPSPSKLTKEGKPRKRQKFKTLVLERKTRKPNLFAREHDLKKKFVILQNVLENVHTKFQ